MNQFRIPAVLALLIGIVMAIWGSKLPLNQDNLAEQSTGEWMISTALTAWTNTLPEANSSHCFGRATSAT